MQNSFVGGIAASEGGWWKDGAGARRGGGTIPVVVRARVLMGGEVYKIVYDCNTSRIAMWGGGGGVVAQTVWDGDHA